MTDKAIRPMRPAFALFILGLAAAQAVPAAAQEFCVACTRPNAIYRCIIDKAAPTGASLKSICTGLLARQGGHASCAVQGGTVFDCDGQVRRVDAKAAVSGGAAIAPIVEKGGPQDAKSAPAKPDPTPRQQAEPSANPATAAPRTVEEAARGMTKSSGEALQKAGDAIAGSTRKAWGCVTSLFKSC